MYESWMRTVRAVAVGSSIVASACGGSGDDAPDPSSHGSTNDAGAAHGTGGTRGTGATPGATKEPTHDAGAGAPVDSDAGASSDRDLAAARFCHADCEREKRCASASAGCEPACVTASERWAEGFLTELAACVEEVACAEDGSCYGNALNTLFPEFADDPVVSHCAQLSHDCGFDENLCPSLLILSPEAQAQAMDCLSLECKDDIGACLTSAGAFSP